jgi:hypothetical protein
MAKWNISSDSMTVEQAPRRSPSNWLRQNGLRVAVIGGLVEAVIFYVTGHALLMMVIGILSVLIYLNVRHRIAPAIRRPLWVVVMAQAIAGLLLPAITVGFFVATILAVGLLIVAILVMLGDRTR